jgi:hypothetical protein
LKLGDFILKEEKNYLEDDLMLSPRTGLRPVLMSCAPLGPLRFTFIYKFGIPWVRGYPAKNQRNQRNHKNQRFIFAACMA